MSFTIEHKVGKHIYLYEVTSYWDREKKQSRQKRKYLGKKDPVTDQIIKPRKGRSPRLAKDYGHVYLLKELSRRIGVSQILEKVFPENHQLLLSLALFEICEAEPLYLFSSWLETTFLPGVENMTPKDLTTFTQSIGRMERERLEFSREWIKKLSPVKTVVYDITSLSSYSELLNYVEWGYNRDSEKLPQINLGMIYAEDSHMPLHYQIFPGSIRDVSTLKNFLNYLAFFSLKEIIFVLDRGFYSGTNISEMEEEGIKFIVPMPRTVNKFVTLHSNNKRKLSNPNNAFALKDTVFFHTQEQIKINKVPLQAHIYFNEQSRSDQTTRFLKKILELEEGISKQTFQSKKEARLYISNQAKGATKFFNILVKDNCIVLTRKPNIISKYMSEMGVTIMLTSEQLNRENLLLLYRQKDYLEKIFDVLKNEFDGKRLRAQSKDAVEGRLFIKFISLILHAALANTMRKKELFKQYSVKEMIYKLKNLRVVEMNNEKRFLTEVSKKQKDIFKKFSIPIPAKT